MISEAVFQEYSWAKCEAITLPTIPPMAFPEMYNPVIFNFFDAETSSEIYAKQTEVAPAKNNLSEN